MLFDFLTEGGREREKKKEERKAFLYVCSMFARDDDSFAVA
jgi:hypothetical protein